MLTDPQEALVEECKKIVEDGVLTKSEIIRLAKWITANPEVRNGWPGKPLFKLLKAVFADNKITKEESRQVGKALQSILRHWAKREPAVVAAPSSQITVEVVDAHEEQADSNRIPNGEWQSDPATDRQRSYAATLGVTVPKNATKGQASELISAAVKRQDDGPATESQRDSALRYGVTLAKHVTVREATTAIHEAKPTWKQVQFFKRINKPFPVGISRQEIAQQVKRLEQDAGIQKLIEKAVKEEKRAAVEAGQEMRLEDIERYGLPAVEEFERWEPVADEVGPYVIIYRSGKSLKVEVVEFEGAEIEQKARGKSRVALDCLFPKRFREDGETWLEWEKEKRLIASKVEYVVLLEKVWSGTYIDNIEEYESLIADIESRASDLIENTQGLSAR